MSEKVAENNKLVYIRHHPHHHHLLLHISISIIIIIFFIILIFLNIMRDIHDLHWLRLKYHYFGMNINKPQLFWCEKKAQAQCFDPSPYVKIYGHEPLRNMGISLLINIVVAGYESNRISHQKRRRKGSVCTPSKIGFTTFQDFLCCCIPKYI